MKSKGKYVTSCNLRPWLFRYSSKLEEHISNVSVYMCTPDLNSWFFSSILNATLVKQQTLLNSTLSLFKVLMAISAAAEIHRNICQSRNSLVLCFSFVQIRFHLFSPSISFASFFPWFSDTENSFKPPYITRFYFFKVALSPLFQKLTSISNVLYVCLQYIDQSSSCTLSEWGGEWFYLICECRWMCMRLGVCECSNSPFQSQMHFIMVFLCTRLAYFHTIRTIYLTDK